MTWRPASILAVITVVISLALSVVAFNVITQRDDLEDLERNSTNQRAVLRERIADLEMRLRELGVDPSATPTPVASARPLPAPVSPSAVAQVQPPQAAPARPSRASVAPSRQPVVRRSPSAVPRPTTPAPRPTRTPVLPVLEPVCRALPLIPCP